MAMIYIICPDCTADTHAGRAVFATLEIRESSLGA
jgi:hypothetical protein